MNESRLPIDYEELRRFFTCELERMPRSLRSYIAQGKEGTERVMAHLVVKKMRQLGWRLDAPERDPRGAISGPAMPQKSPDGP